MVFGVDDAAMAAIAGDALGIAFGNKGKLSARKQMALQYDYQRQLNQTAIQDRVADAEKAGIHPLYALGASLNPGGVSMPDQSGPSLGDRLSGMGQNIGRAISAKQSVQERQISVASAKLDLEGKSLENELLRTQIRNAQVPPGVNRNPILPGQGQVVTTDKEIMPRDGDTEKGTEAAWKWVDYNNGQQVLIPGQSMNGGGMDDGPAMWWNQLTRTVPTMMASDVMNMYSWLREKYMMKKARGEFRTGWQQYKAKHGYYRK